jgi:hypothetical protein
MIEAAVQSPPQADAAGRTQPVSESKGSPAAEALLQIAGSLSGAGKAAGGASSRFARLLDEFRAGESLKSAPNRKADPLQALRELLGSLSQEETARLWRQLWLLFDTDPGSTGAKSSDPKWLLSREADRGTDRLPLKPGGLFEPGCKRDKEALRIAVERLAALLGVDTALRFIALVRNGSGSDQSKGDKAPAAGGAAAVREGLQATGGRPGQDPDDKRARVVVLDLRRSGERADRLRESPDSKTGSSVPQARLGASEAQDRDFTLLLRSALAERPAAPVSEPAAAARSQQPLPGFQERFIPEVVKQTGIILKGDNSGEIRLVLKPENLGSVRIRLALNESSLDGRIVVDNSSVKELVEAGLDNLKSALRQEGFQAANLEVSVGSRQAGDGAARNRHRAGDSPEAPWSNGTESLDRAVPLFLDLGLEYELVNLVV